MGTTHQANRASLSKGWQWEKTHGFTFDNSSLQQWYNLSDPSMEEAVYDRISFQRFLRVDLMLDRIPDETTILHFRRLLEKKGLTEQIFQNINEHLQEKDLLMKKGTIVGATIVRSPSSTKNLEQKGIQG